MATLRLPDWFQFPAARGRDQSATRFKNSREAYEFVREAYNKKGVTEELRRVLRLYASNKPKRGRQAGS